MRKYFLLATFATAALALGTTAHAQGMMGGYYGGGYMMGPGYGHGYMMGPGYGPGYMMGPGYGYDGDGYQRGQTYRGNRLCWHRTDERGDGYYEACSN